MLLEHNWCTELENGMETADRGVTAEYLVDNTRTLLVNNVKY